MLEKNKFLAYDFDYVRQTGLIIACRYNHLDICELLIDNGSNLN